MSGLQARVARAKACLGLAAAAVTDRSPRDWYAPPCPCSRPPATSALAARAQQDNGGAGDPVRPFKANFSPAQGGAHDPSHGPTDSLPALGSRVPVAAPLSVGLLDSGQRRSDGLEAVNHPCSKRSKLW